MSHARLTIGLLLVTAVLLAALCGCELLPWETDTTAEPSTDGTTAVQESEETTETTTESETESETETVLAPLPTPDFSNPSDPDGTKRY